LAGVASRLAAREADRETLALAVQAELPSVASALATFELGALELNTCIGTAESVAAASAATAARGVADGVALALDLDTVGCSTAAAPKTGGAAARGWWACLCKILDTSAGDGQLTVVAGLGVGVDVERVDLPAVAEGAGIEILGAAAILCVPKI
jgi:hypothetical protein